MAKYYNCPSCEEQNEIGNTICKNCEEQTSIGMLQSSGNGSSPKGFNWPLYPHDMNVGSAMSNEIVVPSNRIAKQHFKLLYENKSFHLEMLGADKPVAITGKPMQMGRPKKLVDGAVIGVGLDELALSYFKKLQITENIKDPAQKAAIRKEQVKQENAANPVTAKLMLILGYLQEFHAAKSLDELLAGAVDAVLRITGLERGYAFLVDHVDGQMSLKEKIARKMGGSNIVEKDYTISKSMLSRVLNGDGAVIIDDTDKEVTSTVSMRNFSIKTVVCIPLVKFNHKTQENQLLGVLYADKLLSITKLPGHCRATLQMLSQMVSSNIERCQEFQETIDLCNDYRNYILGLGAELQNVEKNLKNFSSNILEITNASQIPEKLAVVDAEQAKIEAICENINTTLVGS